MPAQDRLYRLFLFLLPASFRHEAGDELVQLFSDHRREASRQPFRLMGLWIAALWDLSMHGVAMRWADRPRPTLHGRRHMRAIWSDIRQGFRLVRRHPTTSLLAIATLALGIGANTAIFSLVDPVLIRSLPYPEPDRLVMVWEKRAREGVLTNVVSPADYLDWRRMNTVFEDMAALSPTSVTVTGDGEPARVNSAVVGPSLFDLLRVRPAAGRSFQAGDDVFGRHRVAIISHGFWQRRFGSDSNIVGRKITINSGPTPWEIVGVLPRDFSFINDYDLYLPLLLQVPGDAPPSRVSHQLDVYARLKPGVTMAQAVDAMDRLGQELEKQYPGESAGHGSHVMPMRDQYLGPVRDSLLVVSAAVGLVLLIACVNVASLLLARAATRQREMAVRSALGANRRRLIVQSLSESLGLSLLGGVAGIVLGVFLIRALPLVMPARLSVVGVENLSLDLRALGFAIALSILMGLAFGLLPALQASRPAAAEMLAAGGRGPAAIRRRARVALVVGEMALASLALVGAGLVIRSFQTTLAQPLGFEPVDRLVVTLTLPAARYPSREARLLGLDDLERRLGAIPGVKSIGAVDILPLGGGDARSGIAIDGRDSRPDEPPVRAHRRTVTAGYFHAQGIQVLRGRGFTADDSASSEPVVIINDAARRRYWGDADPVGSIVRFNPDTSVGHRVVGVVADVRHWGLTTDVNPILYRPQPQAASSSLTFVIHGATGTDALPNHVRGIVGAFDPNLPLADMRTMDEVVGRSVGAARAQTTLMGAFAVLALLLAVIGVYGVTAHVVAARASEIGLRMTLGARPVDVVRELLSEGVRHALVGLAIGIGLGVYLMKLGAAVLYRVAPWDPITLVAVATVVLSAAVLACLVPARRAMRLDPVQALRQE
jgi:putative ABC transport system permease protein